MLHLPPVISIIGYMGSNLKDQFPTTIVLTTLTVTVLAVVIFNKYIKQDLKRSTSAQFNDLPNHNPSINAIYDANINVQLLNY